MSIPSEPLPHEYEVYDDVEPSRRFGWPARVLAILLVLALAVLMIMAG